MQNVISKIEREEAEEVEFEEAGVIQRPECLASNQNVGGSTPSTRSTGSTLHERMDVIEASIEQLAEWVDTLNAKADTILALLKKGNKKCTKSSKAKK